MLLRIEPVWEALESVYGNFTSPKELHQKAKDQNSEIIGLTPSGENFTQEKARNLAHKKNLTLICGRYEGMDARIKNHLTTQNISIGNYVLSGGEIPALAITEAITRLLPGVIKKEEATKIESFSKKLENKAEFPQYTRPEKYKGLKVPEVLLSGNHAEIKDWQDNRVT